MAGVIALAIFASILLTMIALGISIALATLWATWEITKTMKLQRELDGLK
jgi:hypothetical protein